VVRIACKVDLSHLDSGALQTAGRQQSSSCSPRGAGLNHDRQHAPDREAVPVEVRQALLFRSKSSSYFGAVLLVANSVSSSYIEGPYCLCCETAIDYIFQKGLLCLIHTHACTHAQCAHAHTHFFFT
jgi:hypothetical protein